MSALVCFVFLPGYYIVFIVERTKWSKCMMLMLISDDLDWISDGMVVIEDVGDR